MIGITDDQQLLLKLIDAKFETMGAKLEGISATLAAMNDRFSTYDRRFDALDSRIEAVERWQAETTARAGVVGKMGSAMWAVFGGALLAIGNWIIKAYHIGGM